MASVAIIGAGPGGLIAAELIASRGHKVVIYDQMSSVGRKFLMAGKGGLNLTNSEAFDLFLTRYGQAGAWLREPITTFSPSSLEAWCRDLGEETFTGTSGRIFPKSLKASPLLRAWLSKLKAHNVVFALNKKWLGWDSEERLLFANRDGSRETASHEATLLALGGASWPKLGSDGKWVPALEHEGVAVASLQPANCGVEIVWTKLFQDRFAGSPLKPLKLTFGAHSNRGEAVVTERGLEGGPFYALAHPLRDCISLQGFAPITLDLHPDLSMEGLLKRLATPRRTQSFAEYMRKACHLSPLSTHLLYEAIGVEKLRQLPVEDLAFYIKNLPLSVTGTTGIERAISTAGGVKRESVDDHFMLLKKPGVFVAGEMLDWEAPTGGYLLQATFSTGVAAAKGLMRWLAQ